MLMTNQISLSHLTCVYYISFYLFFFGVVNSLAQYVSHKSLCIFFMTYIIDRWVCGVFLVSSHKKLLFVKALAEKEQKIRKSYHLLKVKIWVYGWQKRQNKPHFLLHLGLFPFLSSFNQLSRLSSPLLPWQLINRMPRNWGGFKLLYFRSLLNLFGLLTAVMLKENCTFKQLLYQNSKAVETETIN